MTSQFSQQITLTIPRGWWLIVLIVALLLIAWFIWEPTHRPIVIFISSIFAALGVLLNALNGMHLRRMQLETAQQLQESRQQEQNARRINESIAFIRFWNDPEFYLIQSTCWVAVRAFEGKTAQEQRRMAKETAEHNNAIVAALNFMELMGMADQLEITEGCAQFAR
jgi:hypothetical protein